ncbi:MarR family transcriptional regulator [Nonomuraea sp. G32]|nr:MarR family transcriptional regulator [Nonomuraea sp. G32]MDP4511385.1 MarR family transcriptional regulator [Nonomuraea sp. G32]
MLTQLQNGPLVQARLSERLSVFKPVVVTLVNELEAMGLAERRPHPRDRRAVQVHLLPAGVQARRRRGRQRPEGTLMNTSTNDRHPEIGAARSRFWPVGEAATDLGMTEVLVPTWVFIAVWLVIKAGMGPRHGNLFWLADGLRSIAVIDATGLLLAATTMVVFSRYSPSAARCLLPWLIWMPITLAIKIAAITGIFSA